MGEKSDRRDVRVIDVGLLSFRRRDRESLSDSELRIRSEVVCKRKRRCRRKIQTLQAESDQGKEDGVKPPLRNLHKLSYRDDDLSYAPVLDHARQLHRSSRIFGPFIFIGRQKLGLA